MSQRFTQLGHYFAAVLTLLCLCASNTWAQQYDSFRLVGDHPTEVSGFVTSISLDSDTDQITVNYLNVAGVSSVYNATLTPSTAIPASTPVFMPPAGFTETLPSSLDLEQIHFLSGRLSSSEDTQAPDHWFRLTRFNDQYSGVFRIGNRIYAIDRYSADPTILVRPAQPNKNNFLPGKRVKISAIIDEQYLQADTVGDQQGMDNLGHLFALESINVMDGLLTDSLGISILLEQVIYQPASVLTLPSQPHDTIAGASNWYGSNADAFGLTDNLATLFFRGSLTESANDGSAHPQLAATNANTIVQGNSDSYQFATTHYFGSLLGLINEPGTLQDWQNNDALALPNVHWSERQKNLVELNPPPAELTQLISYDAPVVADQPEQPVNEVDNQLVIAESPEGDGIIRDDGSGNTSPEDASGTGSFASVVEVLALLIILCSYIRVGRVHEP